MANSLHPAGMLADILVYHGSSQGDYLDMKEFPESLQAITAVNTFL
jgi:hypothetical protein